MNLSTTLNTNDQDLLAFFAEDWEYDLVNNPEMATFYGDHRFNDRLSDSSEDAIIEDYQHNLSLLEKLNSFKINELSEQSKINYKLFRLKLEESLESFKFNGHYMPINQMHGLQTYFGRLIEMMPFKKESDYENYLSRLNQFPNKIDQIIDLMKKGINSGYTVPSIAMQDVPNQIKRQFSNGIKESSFYKPLLKKVKISEDLKSKLEEAIEFKLLQSFNKLADFIVEEYIPNCRTTIGLSDLPNGKAFYDFMLRSFTTTNLTAEEIHQIGLHEVERIFSEIKSIMVKANFSDYPAFLDFLRTNPDFYFKSEADLLMHYRDFAKRVDKELPAFFKTLPRLPYGIEKIPDHQAPSSPTAYYMASDFNMSRAGIFFANTYQLETRPKYELQALTLHEAVPGHHLQLSLALELTGLPQFRKSARFTSYVEGWGLYSEKLGEEMGFYEDPYYKFGQLSFEIWRACRLVVDTGIHAFGWSRKKCIDYLQHYTGKSQVACEVEVDRYIVMPGQATSYKIGELKILELRKRAETQLEEKFDLREFHEEVLKNSAVPLTVLEDFINDYINNFSIAK